MRPIYVAGIVAVFMAIVAAGCSHNTSVSAPGNQPPGIKTGNTIPLAEVQRIQSDPNMRPQLKAALMGALTSGRPAQAPTSYPSN